ncbi:hypothetical protein BCR35DRAFT_352917 [Leucosporidium creatinivorum]|uniref:Potassium channel tetramerisation-type BTB domain-containing protein n=1 Tax=Leucosporidium creatinivorum TaxID=106004 RepID=A0A1Y2F4Z5_9BASI|nr:hypothetical protein BCR35DRAFT_352917 [Leucosporidium creatinivorum]
MRPTSLLRSSAHALTLNEPTRKVIVRGVPFHLSPAQLEADSPNIWTENARQSGFWYPLHVDRDPRLFEVVLNHLSGYDIFPLSERGFKTDQLSVTRNLEKDAEFYQLDRLRARVKEELGRLSAVSAEEEARSSDERPRRSEARRGGSREA